MNEFEQSFEQGWHNARKRLRHYFLTRGVDPNWVDDLLQDTAERLWSKYYIEEGSIPENFIVSSNQAAAYVFKQWQRQEPRRQKVILQPPQYFEENEIPFADLWGRLVPSIDVNSAEDYSTAPFDWGAMAGALISLIGDDVLLLYYRNIGASFREISKATGLSIKLIEKRLSHARYEIHRLLESKGMFPLPKAPAPYWEAISELLLSPFLQNLWWWPAWPRRAWRLALNRLRRHPSYSPEWFIWFRRLLDYTASTDEPITFAVIRRLAGQESIITEEQGRRFLLAASMEDTDLLKQEFALIQPNGTSKILSFSDIFQALHSTSGQAPFESYACGKEWMNQVVTFWRPTWIWTELEPH